jgi:hypothetical protein
MSIVANLIVSNLAIRNVTSQKRDKAIEEAVLVVRPGGG